MSAPIPPANPRANYLACKTEIDAAMAAVLDRGQYILGREVELFEQEFARYVGVGWAVGVASGTDAIQLALRVCGIGPGDAVLTVSHTSVATVAAIELAGAQPVLVDIDPATFTMDCDRLEDAIRLHRGSPLKAIIPVHLYGHPAALPDLQRMAARYELRLIEDCAQSHGARLHGRRTGAWGDLAAFSFYPTKNLSALGEGGALVTNNPDLAEQVRRWREYGWRERYISESPGTNSRLDELQAAILRVKLRHLDADNEQRRRVAKSYQRVLCGSGLVLPGSVPHAEHVYHQFVVRSADRNAWREWLGKYGVGTLIHYPVPVHLQSAYRGRIDGTHLAETERAAQQVLSLPMYPELSAEQVEYIGQVVAERSLSLTAGSW